jgi:hypothetical protein
MSAADTAARLARRALAAARDGALGAARAGAATVRAAWRARPPARRAAALAAAAAILAASADGIAFQLSLPSRLPRPLDWAAARAVLERDARRGDAIAVAPGWAERAREALPGAVPIVSLPADPAEPLPGVRRVWLLSLPAAPGFSFEPELSLVRRAARSEALPPLGAIAARRYELAAPLLPLAFLPDRLASASARLGGSPCAAVPGGFACGEGGAVRVVRTVREVEGRPRPCLSLSLPGSPGAPLQLEFPGVLAGRVLRGRAAGADGGASGAPVRVAVQVDGRDVGAVEAGGGDAPFLLDTREHAGRLVTVALAVTWPAPAGAVCLEALAEP